MMIDTAATQLWEQLRDELSRRRQVPTATYRVQFNRTFTFRDAIAQVPYWKALGISHVYASPYFEARADSTHGYDICNHNALNPSIGTEEDYDAFVRVLHEHGMGQILDTVPNHMGIGEAGNMYWMDVLENGPSSPYAAFFDIDWQPLKQEMSNQVLLPILGAQYGHVLENQELTLTFNAGAFFLQYWETQLPLAPRTYTPVLELVLEKVQESAEPDAEHVLELQSIITALSHLPSRTETDAARIAERQREKEIIKRRLNTLVEAAEDVERAVKDVITMYNGVKGQPRSFDRLDELVRSQAYRLAYWRVAAEEINYRRFFDINDLAAIRMEQDAVFEATHQLIMQLLSTEKVNGLRIDHPDGLWDPAGYFRNLQRHYMLAVARQLWERADRASDEEWDEVQQALSELYDEAARTEPHGVMARPLYVVAEKILGHGEELPSAWTIDGTSGYEFLNLVNGLFVQGSNARVFEQLYSTFIQERTNFGDLVLAKKKQIMLISLVSEVNVLAHQLSRLAERTRYHRDFTLNSLTFALREVIACFPIYRTYIADGVVPVGEVPYVETAIDCAKKRNPVTDPSVFDFIRDVLLLRYPGMADDEDRRLQQDWVQKFQQVTGPVMAKGLEDTAFYIYNRLISLNEVGGEPQHFGTSVAEFHRANAKRLRDWPHTMLTTSTHDTKRSEDVRTRIDVLSEMPKEWRAALSRWSRMNGRHRRKVEGRFAPSRNEEYLLYQTLLGAWPAAPMSESEHANFVERIQNYMQKALKEAKVHTSWVNPNEQWDTAVSQFVARVLANSPSNAFLADLQELAARVSRYGAYNALSQVVLKLTAPGMPDIYQGNENWDLSLVDPDNRRPVDYSENAWLLAELNEQRDDTLAATLRAAADQPERSSMKLYVTARCLRLRREQPASFAHGDYIALEAKGAHSDNVVTFARHHGDDEVVVVVPRLLTQVVDDTTAPLGTVWDNTVLALGADHIGARYRNLFTGEDVQVNTHGDTAGIPLAEIFASVPVAVLVKSKKQG